MAGGSHFDNPARREWWSVHVEAWQRSGLSRKKYCRVHKLTDKTFARWIDALTDAKMAKIRVERAACERRQKRGRKGVKLTTDRRNRAAQAYWAMHVEALDWSGMTVREYAARWRSRAIVLRVGAICWPNLMRRSTGGRGFTRARGRK